MTDITKTPLNLPAFGYRLAKKGECVQIFDVIRKKFVTLTPEEWVRQHFVSYLINFLGVPYGLVRVEAPLSINGVNHRADIVVYGRAAQPLMVVECKQTDVQLTTRVVEQVCRYNIKFNAPYVLVTNGLQHVCVKIDRNLGSFEVVKIPLYSEIGG